MRHDISGILRSDSMSELQVVERPSVNQGQVLKLDRRASRSAGLFAPELLRIALKQSFIMLRPDIQWKNPVMFVVEIGTVLTFLYTLGWFFGYQSQAEIGYLIALDI